MRSRAFWVIVLFKAIGAKNACADISYYYLFWGAWFRFMFMHRCLKYLFHLGRNESISVRYAKDVTVKASEPCPKHTAHPTAHPIAQMVLYTGGEQSPKVAVMCARVHSLGAAYIIIYIYICLRYIRK